jgi:hypothetical protein
VIGVSACPVCSEVSFTTVVERQGVPVNQNLVCRSEREARTVARGDLTMVACHSCGFLFNRTFEADKLHYDASYDNTQLASNVFRQHVDALVRRLVDERGVRHAQIVEVGCGKGGFIRALVADRRWDNRGIGFDPTYVGPDQDLGGRLRFERTFYDASSVQVEADVVVSRHVIEHVERPLELLGAVAAALARRPDARLFLETPCVEWILKHDVFWDFFYEHCSLFTAGSLMTACERAGFTVDQVDHVFGGQYLWLEAANRPPLRVTRNPGGIREQAERFSAVHTQRLARCRAMVRDLARVRRLALWGAAAKGATFANLIDRDREYFDCLVDINPAKQGGFAAGTGHPILAPGDLRRRGVSAAVVLNSNYRDEVIALLCAQHLPIEVLDFGAIDAP